jgi:hypothetical protein
MSASPLHIAVAVAVVGAVVIIVGGFIPHPLIRRRVTVAGIILAALSLIPFALYLRQPMR